MGVNNNLDNNLVNLSEASRRLGVTKVTLWRWIKKGKVAPVRLLGLPFLTFEQVECLRKEMIPFKKFSRKCKKNNQATEQPMA